MFPFRAEVNIKSIYSRVLEMVKAAEKETELKLQQKRARLFHLLSQENLSFEKELREQNNLSADYEFKDRLKKMLDIKRKTELEHEQFIEKKQLQQQFINSMEMRELISKKQLKEAKLGQIEQIKLKAKQNERENKEKRYWYEMEMRTQQDKYFHDKIIEMNRNQRNREIVETLEKQIANKNLSKNAHKLEAEIESEFLHRKMEQCKLSDEQRKLKEFKEAEQWKKELQCQIEYRRIKRDVERFQAIESEKQRMKCIENEMKNELIQKELTKQLQHEDNLKFYDYTQKVKSFKDELEFKPILANCQRMNDNFDEAAAAAAESAKQNQILKDLEKAAYINALNKKHYEITMKAEEDVLEFAKTEKANAEYNRRMAAERHQNTLRVKQDLENQIEERNRQMVAEQKQHRCTQNTPQCMNFLRPSKLFVSTPKMHPFHWSLNKTK